MDNLVTYTFSRALSMMRYSGAKMRPEGEYEITFFFIKDNKLHFCSPLGRTRVVDDADWGNVIYTQDIMGSWVEVKYEIL